MNDKGLAKYHKGRRTTSKTLTDSKIEGTIDKDSSKSIGNIDCSKRYSANDVRLTNLQINKCSSPSRNGPSEKLRIFHFF